MTVLSSGIILLTGKGSGNGGQMVLGEYNADGSLQTAFGAGGIVTYGVYGAYQTTTLAVLTDGEIQVGTLANVSGDYLIAADFYSNGTLNTNYATNGAYEIQVNGMAWAMMLDSYGNIVLVG